MPPRAPSLLAAAALAVALLTGCSAETPPRKPEPTYDLPAREVRPDEQPVRVVGKDGDTEFEIIGLTKDISALQGSHAEMYPKGRFFRLRVVVTNIGRASVLFNAERQQLVLSDGSTRKPDGEATLVRRQPTEFDLGSGVRVEFDLYYDVPESATPKALRAFGGPILTDLKDEEGTDIALG